MANKRLIIIVEGDTEEEFVKQILKPHLKSRQMFDITAFKIKHSKGGLSKYQHLKTDILNCIYQTNTIVTTLIDFYRLPSDFPQFNEAKNIHNKKERLDFLEKAIKEEIESSQNKRFDNFIPYIQLHEFEALVFSSSESIFSNIEPHRVDKAEIEKIFKEYQNPEDINDNPNTAPSKRLSKYIKGYQKNIDGIMIIQSTNLIRISEKCLRFTNWLENICLACAET